MQGWPTRGTRATSGTRMISKWHAQSHYNFSANGHSKEFTNFWKNLPPSPFPALSYRCRFGSTYICEKAISYNELVKIKYRSILADHLKNLLILATSSVNPNTEKLVNGKDIQST